MQKDIEFFLKLTDATRALSSLTRTTLLASRVPRFLQRPQLGSESAQASRFHNCISLTVHIVLPPPTFGRGYINLLNDDTLLEIFNCYRLDEGDDWNDRISWCKLTHVCQRWRHLVYESTFHLGMHIKCTNGTPIVDTLDHLPPLPLLIHYSYTSTEQDELKICHALRLHDRVRDLYLRLQPSIFQKCLMLMAEHFPTLEYLTLIKLPTVDSLTPLTLPEAFLAPNIRHLSFYGIRLPKRLRLLTSTISLVRLTLWDIKDSSYFRPRLIVARLRSLPQLEELHIGFSVPVPRPSTERELLGEQGIHVTLPNMNTIEFQGVSVYLESFIAQIRAPVLKRLEITLFNQIAFTLQHLCHFINITEGFKSPVVKVCFGYKAIYVTTSNGFGLFDRLRPFFIEVKCKPLDWQIDCATQICTALAHAPLVSDVGQFILAVDNYTTPEKWLDGEIDETNWHELLRSFVGMKELHIEAGLLEELSRALQMDELGSDPGFLPDLQEIVANRNLFTSFIDARQVMGRPVQFSPPPPPLSYTMV